MEHPHVSMIRERARQFATGHLSVARLQLSLSSVESAIEGDMLHAAPLRTLDLNAFVERYHRSFEYECLRIYHPHDLETATAVTAAYQRFYNEDRPHQGLSCGNLPPRVAFPTLPTLPTVPTSVDADRWLQHYDGHSFVRRVQQGGSVTIANLP